MKKSCRSWKKMVVFLQSLGWRVLVDWAAKEVQQQFKLEYKPEVFSIIYDHLILRFKMELNCLAALKDGL